MFDPEDATLIATHAEEMEIEPAALLAIAEVESGGRAFALVDKRREPLIRFEGHYFDQRLKGDLRRQARDAGLASPVAGAIGNPRQQALRWRLLRRAAALDHQAAHESVSWGLGQVMGAHWRWLGLESVDALVAEARSGVAGQVRLMTRFIEAAGLTGAIRERNWEKFARGYNGPAYARYRYHINIANAYRRHVAAANVDSRGVIA